jgi:hypothetical protein
MKLITAVKGHYPLFYDYALASMQHLFEALFYGLKKSSPVLDMDTS